MGIFQRSIYSVSFEDMSIISYFSYLQIFLHGLVWGWTMEDFLETLVDSLCKVHDLLSRIECTQCRHENICLSIWWIYIQSGTPCNMSIGQDDIEAPRSLCIEILHNAWTHSWIASTTGAHFWSLVYDIEPKYERILKELSRARISVPSSACAPHSITRDWDHGCIRSW